MIWHNVTRKNNVKTILILFLCLKPLSAKMSCHSFEKCGECISFGGEKCVWCSEPNITKSRCQPESSYTKDKNWCKAKYIYNPKTIPPQITNDEPLRSGSDEIEAVQLRPQAMIVKVRPGQLVNFTMYYKPSKDFPLDVYYLMDYSYTMNKHVTELKKQSRYVYSELIKYTNNVQFGMGSFVEKSTYPYVGWQKSYAFRHHLSLTSNISLFDDAISSKRDFGNYDLPEASLDGLMQVMACDKTLGWRPNVRRIIVLCTDSTYHSAGDGKMAQAYKPNDMKCHLDGENFYNLSLIQDYPSVSQINKVAVAGNFKIIFAAHSKVKNVYWSLASEILGAQYAELTQNSNILQIIKTAYSESLRHVTISHLWPSYIQLSLSPDCSKYDHCEVKHNQTVEMKATLKVNNCPEDPTERHQILEAGLVNGGLADKLKINLEIICECNCELAKNGVKNSPTCSKSGTYQCGVCACNDDRYGNVCQCNGTLSSNTDLDKCKMDNNDSSFCSGRGKCVCGQCLCNVGYSGDYCEFNDEACKRRDNKLCSDNGRCSYGACKCNAHWTGDDCSCSNHDDNCYAPYSKEICSGNGDCVCNECICRKLKGTGERYSGVFCEDCKECAERRCKELEGYVLCNFVSNKTYCDDQFNETSIVEILNKTEMYGSNWPSAKWCRVKKDKDKSIVFIHMYNKIDKKFQIKIQRELDVEPEANVWVPVGIAIFTVILIGLLTVLVWKIIVDKMDQAEYNKFLQESKTAGFDVSENPIYQPSCVNFTNPAYNIKDNSALKGDTS